MPSDSQVPDFKNPGISLQGLAGDWVAVDFGFDGCRTIPQDFTLASPYFLWEYSASGPPTDFTLAAASSGLEPPVDASAWQQLLTVSHFEPTLPSRQDCVTTWGDNCPDGTFMHTFAIPAYNASVMQPAPPIISHPIASVRAETGMPQDLNISLEGVFQLRSNTCCPQISVSFANLTSDAPSTPLKPPSASTAVTPSSPIFLLPNAPPPDGSSRDGSQGLAPFAGLEDDTPSADSSLSLGSNSTTALGPAVAYGSLAFAPAPQAPGPSAAGSDPFSQYPGITFGALPSWLSYQFNMTDTGPRLDQWGNSIGEGYDALPMLVVSNEVEVADLGQYLIQVAGTDPSNNLTTLTYFTLSIQDYYQLRAQVQLAGISAAQFDEAAQQAFRQGIASVLGVTLDQVVITGVADVPTSNRRRGLQQAGQTALQVDFNIQGIQSQAAAGNLATSMSTVVSSGALDTTLHTLGEPQAHAELCRHAHDQCLARQVYPTYIYVQCCFSWHFRQGVHVFSHSGSSSCLAWLHVAITAPSFSHEGTLLQALIKGNRCMQ